MTKSPLNRHSASFLTIVLIAALSLVAAACGGAGEGSASAVASLEDVATDEPLDDGEPTLAADDAALEFSACMRDQGLDFPDIGVDSQGNPDITEAFQSSGVEPRSAEFRDAMDACVGLLQDAGFGSGRAGLADNTEIQDALVAYSECLRDEGLDVGDIQLGGGNGPGGGANGAGAEPGEDGPPEGRGQGGFGDRSGRIAGALGLDPGDAEVAAALDTCNPILDSALSSFGPGANNNA